MHMENQMIKSTHFTMTSNDFFALIEYNGQRLSSGDKIVYQVLCSHLYGKSYCYPSIKTIANESALTARSVQRSLTRLQTAGLITVMFRQEAGCWCKCDVTGGNENHQIHPAY